MTRPCEKCCETCPAREDCPGCGRVCSESGCPIATCAHEKGHETCATCSMRTWCPTKKDAPHMAKRRIEEQAAQRERVNRIYAQAKPIVKWLPPVFWCLIVMEALSWTEELFTGGLTTVVPSLIFAGLGLVLYVAIAVCLWQLQPLVRRYRIAAICHALIGLITFVDLLREPLGLGSRALGILLALPNLAAIIVFTYQFCEANGELVAEADGELAQKWEELWKWLLITPIATVAAAILSLIMPFLGMLAMLASLVAMLVFGIREYILLWKTIELYKLYLEE